MLGSVWLRFKCGRNRRQLETEATSFGIYAGKEKDACVGYIIVAKMLPESADLYANPQALQKDKITTYFAGDVESGTTFAVYSIFHFKNN